MVTKMTTQICTINYRGIDCKYCQNDKRVNRKLIDNDELWPFSQQQIVI